MTDPEVGAPLALATEQDQHTQSEWEAAAAAVLRKTRTLGADDPDSLVWEKLTRTTLDGIPVTPLGLPTHLEALRTTGRPTRAGAWDIRARLAGDDAKLLNEHALTDLDGGVTSLWVRATPETDFRTLLDGVLLDLAPAVLEPAGDPVAVAKAFLELATGDLHADTNLGVDPIGASLRGLVEPETAENVDHVVAVARLATQHGVRGVVVDATAAHDLGASDAQELGYSVYAGVTYLRVLTGAGYELADAARLIEFRYAATDEQFPTIAKLRAGRRLWARVLELSGLEPGAAEQRQHAVTSRPMLSKYDPYVNMLRTTVAAFAAGVGGADAVTVLPFDSPLGQPDAFGRRIARNVSHLLIDESHVHEVADPAGGAYAVEKLTDDLAAAGWAELGELETTGLDAFRTRVGEVAAKREAEIARRKRPITGLTEFPNLAESLPAREPNPTEPDVRRYGASFEALRDEPATSPVFLATLGTIAQHTARATFASNLFAAGGIAVEVAGPTGGVDDLLASYDGQSVVCLAGTDHAYAEWGAAAAAALRGAGAQHVIVAGRPTALGDEQNVDDSCAVGVDALAFLTRTREKLA
ncbi:MULTISPECIES: methylmalonyl-CoA mutase family protein [Nocardioides]|uniref:Methylmalonyl-CoA mutase family protein n=1 Tax=Nocardioides vastitatis TaxID=2568655 RepID=A0ABW0ZDR8_9ACTN|nr:methylmalonyl-CoA mutase family protein [Nocardioides sp.]THJ10500.1 methylmalonyl-CoA mutase [Nocardioides sp.]